MQAPAIAADGADEDGGALAPPARARTGAGSAGGRAGGQASLGLGSGFPPLGDMQPAGKEARVSASRGRQAEAERAHGGLGLGFEPLPDLPLAPLAAATPARADTTAPATAAKPARCAWAASENTHLDIVVR